MCAGGEGGGGAGPPAPSFRSPGYKSGSITDIDASPALICAASAVHLVRVLPPDRQRSDKQLVGRARGSEGDGAIAGKRQVYVALIFVFAPGRVCVCVCVLKCVSVVSTLCPSTLWVSL